LGSGTTAVVCLREGRRFYGGDLNPEALRFAMARILDEELAQPTLCGPAGQPPAPRDGGGVGRHPQLSLL
jgi:hypothetical protein